MTVKPIPDGYHAVTPYLFVKDAKRALDFYKRAFDAQVLVRMDAPDGRIAHAELRIGDSKVMLADEFPEMGSRSPHALGGSAVSLLVYVENADTTFQRAIAAGGEELRPIKDQFYGDRSGSLRDPSGHLWMIATHKEDVPPDELQKRSEAEWRKHATQ